MYCVPHFIHGKPYSNRGAQGLPIYNPALGEQQGVVFSATPNLCDEAIAHAKEAFLEWSRWSPLKRTRIFFKFRELLEKNSDSLAKIVTSEHGKTLEDARGSIQRAIEVVEYHCGLMQQLHGDFSANVSQHVDCYTLRQPLGVCVGISPFNFPVMVPIWMIIPAIACGNTFILKPSEQDPSASIRLLELLHEAGLPPGVVQCLQGNKTTVDYLIQHPEVAAVTAVASTPVARSIYQTAIAHGKRSATFGGAKNHCVVMPDADVDFAAQAITSAAFGSAGERCMAISAVVVVGNSEHLLKKMCPFIEAIRVGDGLSPQCDMGPVINRQHLLNIEEKIAKGVHEGAKLVVDGRDYTHPDYPAGFFLRPSLFTNVTESMSIYQQEIFGPVLVVLEVQSLEEAIALVNRNQYGNGTAIFTKDGYSARTYCMEVQVGMVGVNVPIPVPVANHPFGGYKQSSFGDHGMHGIESIHFYTKHKTITSRWPVHTTLDTMTFSMPTHEEPA